MRFGLQSGVWTNFLAFLLSGAGAVTGASAEQDWVQVVGWIGMAAGLMILLWGVTIDGKPWWRRLFPVHESEEGDEDLRPNLGSDGQREAGKARPDVPDTPMWQAVQYVATALGDDDRQGGFPATLRAIRQAASQGRVDIWGKRELEPPSTRGHVSEIWTPIGPSYWENHKINSPIIGGENREEYDHSYGEPLNIDAQDRYFSLRLRRREIAAQWPPPNYGIVDDEQT